MGESWGTFASVRYERLSQPASVEERYLSRIYTLLGVESVTVRDTTYNNCIRIHSNIDIPASLTPSKFVQWYCEGFGLVKTVSSKPTLELDGNSGVIVNIETSVLELVSTTP